MANSMSKQILEDGRRNAVVKLAGVLDTSDVVLTPAVSLSDFSNNDLMFGKLVGFRINEIDYSAGPGLVVYIEYNSGSPQLIASFAQSDELDFDRYGGQFPNRQIAGYDGGINLRTKGFPAGGNQAYTLIIEMEKIYSQTGS